MSSPSTRAVNPWIVAIAVMFATFMEVLDTTVVNVSLPHIAGNLSATIDESTWVLTSYLVANAIVLPLTGWLAQPLRPQAAADDVGHRLHDLVAALRPRAEPAAARRVPPDSGRDRRRDAAALAGGAARSVPAARARQGHGLLGPRHRRRADPRAGARRLADRHLQLALGVLHQPAGRHRVAGHDEAVRLRSAVPAAARRTKIDYWGIGLLALWVGALQLALDLGQERDWFSSPFITDAGRHVGGSALVAFLVREWMAREPVVDLRVFKDPHLQHRRVPDDDARVRALRQPRAAADHAADAARLSVAAGGHRDGAARAWDRSSACRWSAC